VKDSEIIYPDGTSLFVSQMPTADILEVLANFAHLVPTAGETSTVADGYERLRIELLIRELGL
jgi:hypothetical protein